MSVKTDVRRCTVSFDAPRVSVNKAFYAEEVGRMINSTLRPLKTFGGSKNAVVTSDGDRVTVDLPVVRGREPSAQQINYLVHEVDELIPCIKNTTVAF